MTRKMLGLLAAGGCAALIVAASPPGWAARDNTPPGLNQAQDRGPADPAQTITITVQLNRSHDALFRQTVDALYDPASPRFHHWLTDADLRVFAPAPAQMAAVRAQLTQQGLTIISLSKGGFSLRARGTIAAVSKAFNTEIHDFARNGRIFRANIRNARLGGAAGAYVSAVAGLESHAVHPMIARAHRPGTAQPYAAIALSEVVAKGGLGAMITDNVLSPKRSASFIGPLGPPPTATYSGILYNDIPADDTRPADFTAAQLQQVYGLDAAYKLGLDGTGQTIVLLEGFGYPTVQKDADEAFRLNHLALLSPSNFSVVYPLGRPADPNAGILFEWNLEIALDLQWAHAIAPGAKIVVVATNGADEEDFEGAMQYIVDNAIGYAVSDSWEFDTDDYAGPGEQDSFENILIEAAAKGISFQFSTGDGGDEGLGTPRGAAGVPSVAPHATAVGGTALLNTPGTADFTAAGWGDVVSVGVRAYVEVFDPPQPPAFVGGGGGGESVYWPKPAWQAALPGKGRQTPDISALADPYTGVPIVVTQAGQLDLITGVGGTSLASPIVTAFWAIAQQKAGHALGQAAPTIAALTAGVTDIVPVSFPHGVTAAITDTNGTTDYSTLDLFSGAIPHHQKFVGSLWIFGNPRNAFSLGFGLDTSLTVTDGWDNATGFGTPDGLAFINAAAAYGQN